MSTGRVPLRRFIACTGAVALLVGLVATPVSAGGPSSRPFETAGKSEQRTPVATGRITGKEAARISAASPRPATPAYAPKARPARFAGTDATAARPAAGARQALISGPSLTSVHAFAGIDNAAAGDLEPPDPWVAVNSSYIVQSTNGLVRISDRGGNEKASIATWAMFSVWPGYTDADPRIIWDAYHGRWVGVLLWFDYPYFTDTYLTVIVSETADPLGAWGSFTWSYEEYLPDFPAIASSSDKIVLTANEFVNGASYAGTSFLVAPWSSILAGTDVTASYRFSDSAWNLRPGQVHGTAGDLHLVYESDTGYLSYLRIKGSAAAPVIDEYDLPIPNGSNVTLTPRQPGDPDGILRADDGRIADAVWRGNQLWFTRTIEHAWNTVDPDMAIEVVRVDTTTSAAPTVAIDALLAGTSGVDQFTSGVGTAGSGTAFITYSQSSDSEPPATMATAIHPTLGLQPAITIATSDASYAGDRWGDFAGVAADPLGADTVWQTHETSDADGNWRTTVSRLVLDPSPPTVSAPGQELVKGTVVGGMTVPVRVKWTAGTDAGSGITAYRLADNPHGVGFGAPTLATGTSVVRNHYWKPSSNTVDNVSHVYQLSAVDDAGNVSPAVNGPTLSPLVYQQTSATYSTGWRTSSSSAYLGGSVKYSSTAGKYATFRTSGRSFGFVTTMASTRGKVKVYVDGTYKGTVTLKTATTKFRKLAYVITFASSATHTIKLVVASGRVDVDAFVVLK